VIYFSRIESHYKHIIVLCCACNFFKKFIQIPTKRFLWKENECERRLLLGLLYRRLLLGKEVGKTAEDGTHFQFTAETKGELALYRPIPRGKNLNFNCIAGGGQTKLLAFSNILSCSAD
jgi:hypothetical protein